jgi:hypothetical protein
VKWGTSKGRAHRPNGRGASNIWPCSSDRGDDRTARPSVKLQDYRPTLGCVAGTSNRCARRCAPRFTRMSVHAILACFSYMASSVRMLASTHE